MAEHLSYASTGKPHPFHIVRPSPWPFLGAMAAGLLAVGAVFYMHDVSIAGTAVGLKGVFAGLLAVAAIMVVWWRDVIFEAVAEKAHSPAARTGLRYGMGLFIASEVMFFVAFFWAFFASSIFPKLGIGGIWPPANIHVVDPFSLPFLMTLVLLLSGCTVTWAHHAILENKNKDALIALGATVLLGVIFLGMQAFEYIHAHFGFTESVYASTFYMATGFHGFHVFVGTVFLMVCLGRAAKGHFTADSHFGFEAAAWYWHFVDVVWLFLFVAIYVWGNTVGMSDPAVIEAAQAAAANGG